jgi:hypothetical protein
MEFDDNTDLFEQLHKLKNKRKEINKAMVDLYKLILEDQEKEDLIYIVVRSDNSVVRAFKTTKEANIFMKFDAEEYDEETNKSYSYRVIECPLENKKIFLKDCL